MCFLAKDVLRAREQLSALCVVLDLSEAFLDEIGREYKASVAFWTELAEALPALGGQRCEGRPRRPAILLRARLIQGASAGSRR